MGTAFSRCSVALVGLGVALGMDGVVAGPEQYVCGDRNGGAYQNGDDGPPAEVVFGGWARPQTRAKKWFTAGVR